uniref:Uncharacterized protein n=2 Tax=viral metagenome TaxID=1070528 RepID=A0A6M3KTU8_9ZZZZ
MPIATDAQIHPKGRGGWRLGAGRHKAITTVVREALDTNDYYLPKYLETLREIAFDVSQETRDRVSALVYLVNRSQGSPKAQIDVQGKVLVVTPDMLELEARKLNELAQAHRQLIAPRGDMTVVTTPEIVDLGTNSNPLYNKVSDDDATTPSLT